MTLVTTEIWPSPTPLIVMAADQRITRAGQHAGNRRKLFALPGGARGGISYFGLAEVQLAATRQWMDEWLTDFLAKTTGLSHEDRAGALAAALNSITSVNRNERSGFQLAGFRADGTPEFWYIRNLDDNGEPTLGRWEAREDFQRRDAQTLPADGVQIYRNGDIRAHAVAWDAFDRSLGQLLGFPEFRPIGVADGARRWVKFKLEIVATFYERFATSPIIGRPVDALAITPGGVTGP